MNTKRTIYNPVQKDTFVFLKTFAETQGNTTLVKVELAPKGGVGLHFHKTYSETFTVLEGTLGVTFGKTEYLLKAGETAIAEPNIIHRFYNHIEEKVIFEVALNPGSEGFERSLQVGYGLARDGKTDKKGLPKNILHLSLLLEMSESKLPGRFSVFEFLLLRLAKYARKKGVDKEFEKYYLSDKN